MLRVAVNGVAIALAGHLVPGVAVDGWVAAAVGGLVLGLVNAWVRPALYFMTFPITLWTLGFFLHVLDAGCLWFASRITPGFDLHGVPAVVVASLTVWGLNRVVTEVLGDDRELVLRRSSALTRDRGDGGEAQVAGGGDLN